MAGSQIVKTKWLKYLAWDSSQFLLLRVFFTECLMNSNPLIIAPQCLFNLLQHAFDFFLFHYHISFLFSLWSRSMFFFFTYFRLFLIVHLWCTHCKVCVDKCFNGMRVITALLNIKLNFESQCANIPLISAPSTILKSNYIS